MELKDRNACVPETLLRTIRSNEQHSTVDEHVRKPPACGDGTAADLLNWLGTCPMQVLEPWRILSAFFSLVTLTSHGPQIPMLMTTEPGLCLGQGLTLGYIGPKLTCFQDPLGAFQL